MKLTQEQADILGNFIESHPDVDYSNQEEDTGHYGLELYFIEIDTSSLPIKVERKGKCIVSFTRLEHYLDYPIDGFEFDYYQ